jgi:hypothetical protein
MAYTTIDKPNEYFTTTVYTGNGSTLSISSLEFSPDFVWIKNRNIVSNHVLFDTVRGTTLSLESESNASESIRSGITSFDSNGFTLGSNGNSNANGNSHASWSWRGSDSSAVSNTAGSITSTVSANTTSGFSIVSFTGNATAGATIGHGLGSAPSLILTKNRDFAYNWHLWTHAFSSYNDTIQLNTTAAIDTGTLLNNTAPTSSLITLGNSAVINASGEKIIAYVFAEKKGFSKFGSYTGNGSADGTFVYTGFKPAFVIMKRSDSADSWLMKDSVRDSYNLANKRLFPNQSVAEDTSVNGSIDILSNGFKQRGSDTLTNASGGTYIYMAFAENPFVTSTSIPTTAR